MQSMARQSRRPAAAVGAVLFTLLFAKSAAAQCKVQEWYPGTVYYDTARLARETNAVVYGATQTVERELAPFLRRQDEDDEFVVTVFYGYSQIRNAARAPAYVTGCDEQGFVFVPYDLFAYNMAFGFRYEDFAAFYSASGAGGAFVSNGLDRFAQGLKQWNMGIVNSVAAPLLGDRSVAVSGFDMEDSDPVAEEFNRIELDYIVGAQYENEYLNARAGYVASSGFYGHAEVRGLRLFATSVLTNEFEDLAYIAAGFSSLRGFSEDLQEAIGRTSLFARKIQYESPRLTQPATFERIGPGTNAIDFWTAHLEQQDLADYIDAQLAVAVQPRTLLHIGRVGVHTPNHHVKELLAENPEAVKDVKEGVSAGLNLGVVNLPPMPYYAEKGGAAFSATAEVRANIKNEMSLQLMYRYNDPDLLAVFPYAVGASAFTVAFNVAGR